MSMMDVVNQYINKAVDAVVHFGNEGVMPIMVGVFFAAVVVRVVIYWTVKAEAAFALEFEKRVHKYLGDPAYVPQVSSFHELAKRLLEKTHEEHYNLKRKFRRRRFDQITSITDRIFLITEGAQRLIADTLSQTKFLKKGGQNPRFLEISKFVFESNPVFNRVVGVLPLDVVNDILNVLAGLFVVFGIFGMFLRVMAALPVLSHIDVSDPARTKEIMDTFLMGMAHSMGSSVAGILFSVCTTILNTMLNPETIYYNMVNKFTSALEFLWNDTTTNEVKDEGSYSTDRRAVAFSNSRRNVESALKASENLIVETPMGSFTPQAEEEGPELFEPPVPPPLPQAGDKAAVLRHRLAVLDDYLAKADEDRAAGVMPQEMWEEETDSYRRERARVEAELKELEDKKAA